MRRLDFFKAYTEETDKAADLLAIMREQTRIHEMDAIRDMLHAGGYKINDFEFIGLIAAIYRAGIAAGIRTERRRKRRANT